MATGEEIRMEDVLGKGTRKRPSAATEDIDELQAETRPILARDSYLPCFAAYSKHHISYPRSSPVRGTEIFEIDALQGPPEFATTTSDPRSSV